MGPRDASGRVVPVLRLVGAERRWPELFEPKLVSWSGDEFKFTGFERMDRAGVLQEWGRELL
jgi:hypothetical protein